MTSRWIRTEHHLSRSLGRPLLSVNNALVEMILGASLVAMFVAAQVAGEWWGR